jgi:hypothetical protein
VKRQVDFEQGKLPKYVGLGTVGARGPGIQNLDQKMLPAQNGYSFEKGVFYNPEVSDYICDGCGPSGAHNDIAKPEVAHALWQAVASGPV